MKNLIALCCFFSLALISRPSFSQTKIDTAEITSSVPELYDFHEIIYPIWHEAYPAKDTAALKSFVPQIKASMKKINDAKLPGILKDKEDAWKSQLKEFNTAAENYYTAAAGKDVKAMLDAAESLHHNFEMMIRVIRPVIKALDDYHQILYVIYHKLYPDKKYTEIAAYMDRMIAEADSLTKYPQDKLKKRLGDNVSKYETAAKELYDSTVALKEALKGNDAAKKDEAIVNVHTKYQALEAVFK
jgi:hypothetical protein